jgi:hypothetical protein
MDRSAGDGRPRKAAPVAPDRPLEGPTRHVPRAGDLLVRVGARDATARRLSCETSHTMGRPRQGERARWGFEGVDRVGTVSRDMVVLTPVGTGTAVRWQLANGAKPDSRWRLWLERDGAELELRPGGGALLAPGIPNRVDLRRVGDMDSAWSAWLHTPELGEDEDGTVPSEAEEVHVTPLAPPLAALIALAVRRHGGLDWPKRVEIAEEVAHLGRVAPDLSRRLRPRGGEAYPWVRNQLRVLRAQLAGDLGAAMLDPWGDVTGPDGELDDSLVRKRLRTNLDRTIEAGVHLGCLDFDPGPAPPRIRIWMATNDGSRWVSGDDVLRGAW